MVSYVYCWLIRKKAKGTTDFNESFQQQGKNPFFDTQELPGLIHCTPPYYAATIAKVLPQGLKMPNGRNKINIAKG
ncbi:MAG: hypothetical protein NT040_05525 [Bacteroidetes bacterium]|nr:hypothetical protein [Bacteroidota bacterium]